MFAISLTYLDTLVILLILSSHLNSSFNFNFKVGIILIRSALFPVDLSSVAFNDSLNQGGHVVYCAPSVISNS